MGKLTNPLKNDLQIFKKELDKKPNLNMKKLNNPMKDK